MMKIWTRKRVKIYSYSGSFSKLELIGFDYRLLVTGGRNRIIDYSKVWSWETGFPIS